jgi:hypothetical protein
VRARLLAVLSAISLSALGVSLSPAAAAPATIAVSGTVVDDAGRGLPGATVWLNEDSNEHAEGITTSTDDRGRYSATVPLDQDRHVNVNFANGDDWTEQYTGFHARDGDDVLDFDGQLQHLGSVSGRITSELSSTTGVPARLTSDANEYRASLNTRGDGTYRFDGVPPGRYRLFFESDDVVYSPVSPPTDGSNQIVVAPGQDLTLDYGAARKVRPELGRLVVNYSGPGLNRNAAVTAYPVGGVFTTSDTVTADRPRATLGLAAGRYKLTLDNNTWFGGFSRASASMVTIDPGEDTTIEAYLGTDGPDTSDGDSAMGRFVSEEGVGIPDLHVEVLRPDAPGEVVASSRTNSGGGFGIGRLPAADYSVRVSDATGKYHGRTVTIPEDPTDEDAYVLSRAVPFGPRFAGPASASVTGRLGARVGPVCLHPTNGRVGPGDRVCSSEYDQDGQYEIHDIKPGSYRIHLGTWDESYMPWVGGRSEASGTIFTFSAGENKQLDLPLRSPTSGHLVGAAVDRFGRPVNDLTFFAYAADDPETPIATTTGSSSWGIYYLDIRPYKIKAVDGTGRYETAWLGGKDFASATTVTPLISLKKEMPPIVLDLRLQPLAPPKISGDQHIGGVLTATPGVWPSEDVTLAYQWLRAGSPIDGADTPTYRLTTDDRDRAISVRVEAREPWGTRADSTSAATSKIADVPGRGAAPPVSYERSRVSVKTTVKRLGGGRVRLTVRYSGGGATPTGRVSVRRGSKTVVSWRQLKDGRFSITLRRQPKGRVRYTVRYSGSDAYLPATGHTVRVRVR